MNWIRKISVTGVGSTLWLASFVGGPMLAVADTAVLPKGNGYIQPGVVFYLHNPPGNISTVGQNLDFAQNPSQFSSFAGFGTGVQVDLDYKVHAKVWTPSLAFGLTDSVTLAVVVPIFAIAEIQIKRFKVTDSGGSDLTATAQQTLAGAGYMDPDGTAPIDPINSWSDSGLGDVAVGMRWQFMKRQTVASALTVAVQLPTGKTEDPDLLTDFGLGDGQTDVHTKMDIDWETRPGGLFNASMGYQLQLPAERDVRPFLGQRERARFDLGDIFSVGTEVQETFFQWFPVTLSYQYQKKFKDSYRGAGTQDLSSLEAQTAGNNHVLGVSVGVSSILPFIGKQFPYPFSVRAAFRETFSDNTNFDNQQVELSATAFF